MSKPVLYIFLDVDGVLNNIAAFELSDDKMLALSEECLFNYQYLVDKLRQKYEVKVILSSTWRYSEIGFNKLKEYEDKYDALKLYDSTPISHDHREKEIKRYCDENKIEYKDILIIDDALITNELKDRSIKTNMFDGLRMSEAYGCLVNMFGWE